MFQIFPNPIPGSKIILLCLIPIFLKFYFFFQKNHKYLIIHFYILVYFALHQDLLKNVVIQMEFYIFLKYLLYFYHNLNQIHH